MQTEGKVFEQHGRKPESKTPEGVKACSWIQFPNGSHYLLPRYLTIRYVPVFDGDNVSLDFGEVNDDIAPAVETFLALLKAPEKTEEGYVLAGSHMRELLTAFIKMLRVMLLKNYEWDNDYLAQSLTFSPAQYSIIIPTIIYHLLGG